MKPTIEFLVKVGIRQKFNDEKIQEMIDEYIEKIYLKSLGKDEKYTKQTLSDIKASRLTYESAVLAVLNNL